MSQATHSQSNGWNPQRAWRLRMLWGPLARAIAAVVTRSDAPVARVLAIGDSAGALEALLEHTGVRCEVHAHVDDGDAILPFPDGSYTIAVAVDWLPLVRPSQRERAVAKLCRVADVGVVVANAFDTPETSAAERAVNALYSATTGEDHPRLGRHIENGLPDVDTTRGWLTEAFPHLSSAPVDALAAWQSAASLEAFDQGAANAAGAADAALAALFPPASAIADDGAGKVYRRMLVATREPLPASALAGDASPGADLAAIVNSVALEAASQRRTLDRLVGAITEGRERDREEFRAAIASLAAELHEREAQVTILDRDLRQREHAIANQSAAIAALERRIEETDAHVENLESERDATRVHVGNVEAERDHARSHARTVETERADLAGRVRQLETELAEAHAQHQRLLESPGGRALRSYVRIKRKLIGNG
jgi:hypothetical protein